MIIEKDDYPNQAQMVRQITEEYIVAYHPEQKEVLDEYLKLMPEDSLVGSKPSGIKNFGPEEIIAQVVVPVVLGIITNFLYDLIRELGKKKLSRQEKKLVIKKKRSASQKELIRIYGDEKLVQHVLDYVESRFVEE